MKIVLLGVLLLVLPLSAQDRRPDGGVYALPYLPPESLQEQDVDPLMWPTVQAVNRSGWIWTTESCQGHEDRGRGVMLGFVTDDIGRAFLAFATAARAYRSTSLDTSVIYYLPPQVPHHGQYQVRITMPAPDSATRDRALAVWATFARLVSP